MNEIQASGVNKVVTIAPEASWGDEAPPNSGQRARRESIELNYTRDDFESTEIREDGQTVGDSEGMGKVDGSYKGEVSAGTHVRQWMGLLRSDVVAGKTTGPGAFSVIPGGFERDTGSFITDGFVVGSVVRAHGFVNEVNNDNNFQVRFVSDLFLGGVLVNDDVLITEDGVAVTISEPGGHISMPETDHKAHSDTIEEWQKDILVGLIYSGIVTTSGSLSIPANGNAKIDFKLLGRTMRVAAAQRFVNAVAARTSKPLSSSNGRMALIGATTRGVTNATGLTIEIDGQGSVEPVIFSKFAPSVQKGRLKGNGTVTILFNSKQELLDFMNNTEQTLVCVMTETPAKNSPFVSYRIPCLKWKGVTISDGEKGRIQNATFRAFKGTLPGIEATTFATQDSGAVA